MATIWIHRNHVCDIIIPHKSIKNAREHGYLILRNTAKNSSDICPPKYPEHIGSNEILRISVHGPNFFHEGWSLDGYPPDSWNHRGTVILSPLNGYIMSISHGEPEGFIPYESEGLWKKETRSKNQLDAELDDYMEHGAWLEEQKDIEKFEDECDEERRHDCYCDY